MQMGTPRAEQGQMVESSYGWHDGRYYRRTLDKSDREVTWHVAVDSEEIPDSYDAGGADYPPPVTEWVRCEEPQA